MTQDELQDQMGEDYMAIITVLFEIIKARLITQEEQAKIDYASKILADITRRQKRITKMRLKKME